MKTIEINDFVIVLKQVSALRFPNSFIGDRTIYVYMLGVHEPLQISPASQADFDRLKKALADGGTE